MGDQMAMGEILWFIEKWGGYKDAMLVLHAWLMKQTEEKVELANTSEDQMVSTIAMGDSIYLGMATNILEDMLPSTEEIEKYDKALALWCLNEGLKGHPYEEALPFTWRLAEFIEECFTASSNQLAEQLKECPLINTKQVAMATTIQRYMTTISADRFTIKQAIQFHEQWDD